MVQSLEQKQADMRERTRTAKQTVWPLNESEIMRPPNLGYLYLIGARQHNAYKIGISQVCADSRISNIQTSIPFDLETKYVWECMKIHCRSAEKWLHEQLSHRRIRNEWFSFRPDELAAVVKYAALVCRNLKIEWNDYGARPEWYEQFA
jgi:hypothetical protein